MSITNDEYRRARFISEPASQLILEAIRPSKRGRKSLDPLIFLVGMQLSIDHFNIATVTQIHKVLTHHLTLHDQWDLGVRTSLANGREKVISVGDLYALTKRITKMLDFSSRRAPQHLSKEARHLRRDAVDGIVTALLKSTLIPRPEGSHDYALDGTGIWAAEKGKMRISEKEAPEIQHEEEELSPPIPLIVEDEPSSDEGQTKTGKGQHGESDAGIGVKTDKSGKRKAFYGYDVETLVRVPALSSNEEKVRTEPNLVERLVVIPASKDIVSTCLRMFDRLTAEGTVIKSLLVDRHYSYKKYDRWMQELLDRGIEQVADMHATDQRFRPWDGMLMAAGWAHCPQTPKRLESIPSLGPNSSPEEQERFNALIAERRAYAAKRINPLDKEGKIRFGCPALNGTVGCSLRPGTEATAIFFNLPLIENPPAEAGRPAICCQQSVQLQIKTIKEMIALKMYQRYYWGSKEWFTSYARRTYVEGWFGVLKNSSATGFHRGSHQFVGLPLVSLVFGMAAATTNLRLLRKWHADTGLGDPQNELLQADRPHYGFIELTREQASNIQHLAGRRRAS